MLNVTVLIDVDGTEHIPGVWALACCGAHPKKSDRIKATRTQHLGDEKPGMVVAQPPLCVIVVQQ